MTDMDYIQLFGMKEVKLNSEKEVEEWLNKPNYIKINGKLQHIKIVEAFIGRPLKEKEVVHHLDHNKENNKIDNLMLFSSQKEHKSFENKFNKFGWTNPIKREICFRWRKFK